MKERTKRRSSERQTVQKSARRHPLLPGFQILRMAGPQKKNWLSQTAYENPSASSRRADQNVAADQWITIATAQ